jgi:hypothetical protein
MRLIDSEEALLGMIAKMRGDTDEAKDDLRRWSRGKVGKQMVLEKCSLRSR